MTAPVTAAPMPSAAINDLPDSAFAYIEPGGSKDAEGKTTPRSLRHFPIHDEAHVRNALSRAPQSPFGDKAMPKIREAAHKYGIKVSAMADLLGVELARPGAWQLASGPLDVTAEMLADAARYAQRPGSRPSPVKLGHTDPRFTGDGEPALGWLANLRVEDDNGPVLMGDITGMPDWLAAAAPTAWPDRSVEGWADYEVDGETYGLIIDGLALLGVTPPGMSTIRSLRDLPQALGVAASARIVARAPKTPAATAEVPTEEREAGLMDPVKIREALGLPADASDDEVKASLVTAGFAPANPPPEPVQASLFEVPPVASVPAAAPKKDAAGTMRVDASAWEAAQDRIKKLEAQASKQREAERDQIIAKAVQDGKFAPARREHWVRLWNADPEGAREAIDGLAKNVIPVMASGYAGEGEEDIDAEYAHLFPPTVSSRKGA